MVKALDDGARKVFANEIDPGQLAIIKARTPQEYLGKLVRCLGEFPEFLDFAAPYSMPSTTPGYSISLMESALG